MADDLEHIGSRGLLFPRDVQLATKPRDLSFLVSNGGADMACSLKRFHLAASRLVGLLLALERRRIAHPKGLGPRRFSSRDYSRDLMPAKWAYDAQQQVRSVHVADGSFSEVGAC